MTEEVTDAMCAAGRDVQRTWTHDLLTPGRFRSIYRAMEAAREPKTASPPTGDVETVARALWFDWCDQQGWPNGQPTWDEMAGENAGDRGPRYAEFMALAAAALATLQPVEPRVSSDVVERALVRCSTAMNAFIYKIGLDDAGNYYWTDPPLRAEAQEALAANNEAFAALTDHTTKDDE